MIKRQIRQYPTESAIPVSKQRTGVSYEWMRIGEGINLPVQRDTSPKLPLTFASAIVSNEIARNHGGREAVTEMQMCEKIHSRLQGHTSRTPESAQCASKTAWSYCNCRCTMPLVLVPMK